MMCCGLANSTMNTRRLNLLVLAVTLIVAGALTPSSLAQPAAPAARGRGPQGPQVVSPEVASDRHVTFRIRAQRAEAVRLNAGDIPGTGSGVDLTKGTNDIWEV